MFRGAITARSILEVSALLFYTEVRISSGLVTLLTLRVPALRLSINKLLLPTTVAAGVVTEVATLPETSTVLFNVIL